ncbi:acetyl-CoA hydrolase/transferase family protein [Nocardioides mesophilus]|uniref:Acetyl-CoA hydrolase n=1 Tax=Nocardioides mesophilus TaxID=433659 RepID=A0A7G9REX5_9ACTN|nr:acetyl-CoA hydrolase/transferase C-terminal domain-containing protein [Nocardioides mesophilus]QNN54150.1 acetyl-CoA hydrolase [Nocardioides mesophilus]
MSGYVRLEDLGGALGELPERPRVVVGGNASTPWSLLRRFDDVVDRYVLHLLNAHPGVPDREGVLLETSFVGAGVRRSPRLAYVPARLSLVPLLFTSTLPPDVVLVRTSAPYDGKVSLGPEVNILPAAIEAVRAGGGQVVAQVDPAVPYVYGDGELALEVFDVLVEASDPLGTPAPTPSDDVTALIADRVAARICDGATLQLGIGAVPDAVLAGLRDRTRLRVWSEMVSDGILALERRGCLDAQRPLTASFLLGSEELYRWAHLNPRLRLLRTETVNDPGLIARNPRMVSVNTALQVDLYGQVNASRVHGRIHSGFGGQTDFVVGALHAEGGQALIALRSWHPRADVSTIVPMIEEPVTSFQASAVVTEQGVAALFGHTQEAQARHLVDRAAHPDVRDELEEEGRALGLFR